MAKENENTENKILYIKCLIKIFSLFSPEPVAKKP
jgi:hypothetical protein